MFSFNIGFACSLLPNLTIYDYKQYETIYFIGSPSLDIYFLLTGEVFKEPKLGQTLRHRGQHLAEHYGGAHVW